MVSIFPLFIITGFLLTILYWSPVLNDPSVSAAYQNFLITIEMLFAAILLQYAFPYKPYMELRKDGMGRGVPVKKVADNFRDTLNPGVATVVLGHVTILLVTISPLFHSPPFSFPFTSFLSLLPFISSLRFLPAISSSHHSLHPPHGSGDIVDDAIYNFSRVYQKYAQQGDASEDERELAEKRGDCSASDEDFYNVGTGNSAKKQTPKKRKQGFEKVNLLVGSDEEEIF